MRNMHTRLAKLEIANAGRINFCRSCGYPRRAALELVITCHSDPLPQCTACGQTLNEEGVPLVMPYKRVVLEHPELV